MSGLCLPELSARLWADGAPREDLVTRVCAALRAEIAARGLAPGTRLPSEAVLSQDLRISRPTLREAARVLAQEGLLDIRHGVGTFVTAGRPPLRNALDSMSSLTSAIRAAGGEPRVTSLAIEEVEPPRDVAAALRLQPGARTTRIMRVRLIDDRPLGLACEYVPVTDATPFSAVRAFDGTSLYIFLTQALGIVLLSSEMSVTAVSATPSQARLLAIRSGAPLLFMRETHIGEDGRRVLHSVNHHNSAVIDLTLVRAGVRM
jgi:DNA-binding GntR family transcriptional regulator